MRISDAMNTQATIINFAQLRQQVDDAQTQVSSGLSFSEASQNPAAAAGVMQNNTQLNALAQYQQNANTATRRVNLEESVLSQMNTLLANAQQLADSGIPRPRQRPLHARPPRRKSTSSSRRPCSFPIRRTETNTSSAA